MGISLLLGSGFRASGSAERELGCAIIRHAVRAWKRTEPGGKAYNELVRFFNGRWFEFLWSSLMNERVEVVLDTLGVPGVTTAGLSYGGELEHKAQEDLERVAGMDEGNGRGL